MGTHELSQPRETGGGGGQYTGAKDSSSSQSITVGERRKKYVPEPSVSTVFLEVVHMPN